MPNDANRDLVRVRLVGPDGVGLAIDGAGRLSTSSETGGLTDTELRDSPVPVSGGFLTDAQLRAAAVPVSDGAGSITTDPKESVYATGNITSNSTTLGPYLCYGYSTALLTMRGTYAGVNITFEASDDGVAWFPVLAARRDSLSAPALTSGVITTNASISWLVDVTGWQYIRVRSTAYTSGTGIFAITLTSATASAVQTYSTNGTMSVSGTATTTPANPTPSAVNSAASTNATAVKTSAGNVFSVTASNTNAAARYVKLYNKASAPTVGTDAPILTIPVPPGAAVNVNFGSQGYRFATGIALAITTGAADSDTGAVAAGEIKVLTSYI